jgi:hypothetical protein
MRMFVEGIFNKVKFNSKEGQSYSKVSSLRLPSSLGMVPENALWAIDLVT